ncbi:FAD/NAD(P)-binding domain-containing protein [Chloropicon primus]|uniref:FAD/NAD(P)-binding domain-containing protein n=1 Tax=Chloropicon primus TaxID=1764295 RepID=A0A5B8MUZ0_9CHLO|nr:FAD/NAD(P)-binding domain-containing protein [Chloropicon primus]UPR02524.1 FAD/NAD(P)-binding domain-containing protein [Chloropicon primus]|eukprot:QDZ23312.1 FAD/NAD(P)-binding domain-containing protein [Chloropicon primus]
MMVRVTSCRKEARCIAARANATTSSSSSGPKVAIVGAGWAGFGAAKGLCEALEGSGAQVTLLDSIPDPTGRTKMVTASGKPFEAGQRGFWKDYPNINRLVAELGLQESEIFTEFTGSAFYSPDGLEATAPVFGDAPEFPSPFGQVLATFDNFKRLPVSDRATMLGLLLATLDLYRDEATFERYDRMTAAELFERCGMSKRLVDEFVAPTLRVGLFKDPSELSAAVSMELLYYYALAHQNSFDVRWIKRGSIAESIILPMADRLVQRNGLAIRGSSRVNGVDFDAASGRVNAVRFTDYSSGSPVEGVLDDLDAVVLALGAKGMKAVMSGSPNLQNAAPELVRASQQDAIDVVACRLWLDKKVPTLEPANVFSRFEGLRGAGGTFFMLDQLQKDSEAELWAGDEIQGSVLACDFYGADRLMALDDEGILRLLMEELLPAAEPGFGGAKAVDWEVRRYPGAVSWFSPGSFSSRPPLETSVRNLMCAGDWVRMGDREHGSKGLCQERAFVSGLEAANALLGNGSLGSSGRNANRATVLPVRDDEPQVVLGRQLNNAKWGALASLGIDPPWLSSEQ